MKIGSSTSTNLIDLRALASITNFLPDDWCRFCRFLIIPCLFKLLLMYKTQTCLLALFRVPMYLLSRKWTTFCVFFVLDVTSGRTEFTIDILTEARPFTRVRITQWWSTRFRYERSQFHQADPSARLEVFGLSTGWTCALSNWSSQFRYHCSYLDLGDF